MWFGFVGVLLVSLLVCLLVVFNLCMGVFSLLFFPWCGNCCRLWSFLLGVLSGFGLRAVAVFGVGWWFGLLFFKCVCLACFLVLLCGVFWDLWWWVFFFGEVRLVWLRGMVVSS